MRKIIIILLMIVVFANVAEAQDFSRVLINSQKWQDVYSGVMYANFNNRASSFLVSDRHGTSILNAIPNEGTILIVSSQDLPFIKGYGSIVAGRGYEEREETYKNVNLELAKKLDFKNFIIVDDSYGYNAIAVAPYAIQSKSYVLFADEKNINEIDEFLREHSGGKILIYGQVDRQVTRTLSKYGPETINKNNDRFSNNVEMVKKYQAINHQQQIVLTNGEFIESEIMSGRQPVVFIGTGTVPEVAKQYIRNSDIQVGVLVGNELVGTATNIKRDVGISVFVKFAQSARASNSVISQVEALDMFYLPVYNLNIILVDVKYNKATNQLEVTLKNTEDQATYFKGTYTINNNGEVQTTGDTIPVFLDGNEIKTMVYDLNPIDTGATIDVFIVYGESPFSMEKVIDTRICPECDRRLETVEVFDDCKINITSAPYSERKKQFSVNIQNIGEVACYVDAEVVDLVIAGNAETLGSENSAHIQPSQTSVIRVGAPDFLEEDYEDNPQITVRGLYGEREGDLIKSTEKQFPLIMSTNDFIDVANLAFYALLIVIVIALLLIFWFVYKRRKEEDDY